MLNTYEDFQKEVEKYPLGTLDTQFKKFKDLIELKKVSEEEPIFFHHLVQTMKQGTYSESNLSGLILKI